MKKQIKRLSLNKKTISNLCSFEMRKLQGGGSDYATCKGHTCNINCNITQGKTCHNPCMHY